MILNAPHVGRPSEFFQTEIIEQLHAKAHQREDVNRRLDPLDLAAFLGHVGTQQRDVPLLEERDH